jgi:hypothetical protein
MLFLGFCLFPVTIVCLLFFCGVLHVFGLFILFVGARGSAIVRCEEGVGLVAGLR